MHCQNTQPLVCQPSPGSPEGNRLSSVITQRVLPTSASYNMLASQRKVNQHAA